MHYPDNTDENILQTNDVSVVITTNERKMMMPYEDLNRLKKAIKTTNNDPVSFEEDRFQCDDAQLNIMPILELRTLGSDGQTYRINLPW